MKDDYLSRLLSIQPPWYRSTLYGLLVPLSSLLGACQLGQPSELERTQLANIQLTKTLHTHLNQQNWQAVEKLCAQTVRYRGRANHFAEADSSLFVKFISNPTLSIVHSAL